MPGTRRASTNDTHCTSLSPVSANASQKRTLSAVPIGPASIEEQGSVAMTGLTQRKEYEFSAGGSYALAPGLVMFADYLYQNRKQGGFNFASNTPGVANNQVQGQGFVLGTQVTW